MTKLEDEADIPIEDNEFTELGSIEPINDETITQEQINEMKMLGMERPKAVSWERWNRLQNIRVEHDHMIRMAAGGVPQWKIAEDLGYDQAHVSKVLNTPEVRLKVQAMVQELYGDDWKNALKDRNAKAIGVIDDTLTNGKESEKASMAKWVLEHTVGKATQDIKVEKRTLSEIYVKIEELNNNKLREVGSSQQLLPKPKHEFDNIIEQVIPKGMVIGKRGGNSEG